MDSVSSNQAIITSHRHSATISFEDVLINILSDLCILVRKSLYQFSGIHSLRDVYIHI